MRITITGLTLVENLNYMSNRHCAEHRICLASFSPHYSSVSGSYYFSHFTEKKLKSREVRLLAQGHWLIRNGVGIQTQV